MKYKVGDKVRVKSILLGEYVGGFLVVENMTDLSGTVHTITNRFKLKNKSFYFHISGSPFNWSPEMLEPIEG